MVMLSNDLAGYACRRVGESAPSKLARKFPSVGTQYSGRYLTLMEAAPRWIVLGSVFKIVLSNSLLYHLLNEDGERH